MSADLQLEIIQLQAELRASEARFYNAVDISPDGIVVINTAGFICFINGSAQSIFGRQKDNLVGREFGFPVVTGDKTEIEILTSHGKSITVEMRVVEIVWEKKPAYLASLRDISAHTLLQNNLNNANQELKQFGYAVSHDIKSPLRNVQTIATWLKEDNVSDLNPRAIADLDLMISNINRMLHLVDGLLQFTQIGALKSIAPPVELNEVLCEVLDNLDIEIQNSGAEITIGTLPRIQANDILLVSLFQNILINSIKYRSNLKPKICINAHKYKAYWKIAITDNGIGIEKQYWKKIFAPFERLHTQSEYEGSGIGLASCKKIVGHHNGRIWVESIIGKGSTFFVLLPAQAD